MAGKISACVVVRLCGALAGRWFVRIVSWGGVFGFGGEEEEKEKEEEGRGLFGAGFFGQLVG